ncbi:hypothetical protein CMK15_02735 [Candidatus Poribacteria bacterium]|nr:hypothetical protein [Candidatus Poribacteria bacterium]
MNKNVNIVWVNGLTVDTYVFKTPNKLVGFIRNGKLSCENPALHVDFEKLKIFMGSFFKRKSFYNLTCHLLQFTNVMFVYLLVRNRPKHFCI